MATSPCCWAKLRRTPGGRPSSIVIMIPKAERATRSARSFLVNRLTSFLIGSNLSVRCSLPASLHEWRRGSRSSKVMGTQGRNYGFM